MAKISDLNKWAVNPRKITESEKRILKKGIEEFGDLSGIVYNVKMNCLVGGHQRTSVIGPDSEVFIEKKYSTPTEKGTVAEGYVLHNGERYSYREVAWDEPKHAAAALMANEAGGDWDWGMLPKIMAELEGNGFADIELTGFDLVDVEKILGGVDNSHEKFMNTAEYKTNMEKLASYLDKDTRRISFIFGKDEYEEVTKYFSENSTDDNWPLTLLGIVRSHGNN